jgi:protein ImuA
MDCAVQDTLARLRRSLAKISQKDWLDPLSSGKSPTGHPTIDEVLGGGLARAALHEVFATTMADAGAAMGFGLGLALRFAEPGRKVLWVQQGIARQEYGSLHPPGFAEFGADPSSLLLVCVQDALQALRAGHEALRCAALGVVILELRGTSKALDLTASQRLARAAATTGVGLVMIRTDAAPQPSAAMSRWGVRAMPSTRLEANAPGQPAFEITLLRHRAGVPQGRWQVEWNRDDLVFREPGKSAAAVSRPSHRPAAATSQWRRAG